MFTSSRLFKNLSTLGLIGIFIFLISGWANAQTCPVEMSHYWMLDETSAPYDDFCNFADATCTNCLTDTADSKVGSGAQQFDGINDEVNVADDDTFDWGAENSFSIEYWMKTSVMVWVLR